MAERIKKIFAQMKSNVCTDEVERINYWRKYFWTDERLKKIIIFEQMRSIGQMTEENFL